MAEFIEIMKQAYRLCGTTGCRRCPIVGENGVCLINPNVQGDYLKAERCIIDWAKAHPEPVYPSWEEGWKQLFPNAMAVICPLMCVTGDLREKYYADCKNGMGCDKCKQALIPAEIAKKLGIKPIGGNSNGK